MPSERLLFYPMYHSYHTFLQSVKPVLLLTSFQPSFVCLQVHSVLILTANVYITGNMCVQNTRTHCLFCLTFLFLSVQSSLQLCLMLVLDHNNLVGSSTCFSTITACSRVLGLGNKELCKVVLQVTLSGVKCG